MKTSSPSKPLPDYGDRDIERFTDKFYVNEKGCWVWKAAVKKFSPYNNSSCTVKLFRLGQKTVMPQRFAWLLEYGEDPLGNVLRRTCEDPRCINPRHYKKEQEETEFE